MSELEMGQVWKQKKTPRLFLVAILPIPTICVLYTFDPKRKQIPGWFHKDTKGEYESFPEFD